MKNFNYLLKIIAIATLATTFLCIEKINAQETATIGAGTYTSSQFLYNKNYNYNYSQQIYTASELAGVGLREGSIIYSIAFQKSEGGSASDFGKVNNWDVYLANTDKNSFDNNSEDFIISGLTKVYSYENSGAVNITNVEGWVTINFETPFVYTGQNLCVAVDENSAGYTSGAINWYYSTAGNYQSILYYSDYTNIDPYNPSSGDPSPYFLRQTNRNNIQLTFDIANHCYDFADIETPYQHPHTPHNPDGLPNGWSYIYNGTMTSNPRVLTDDFYNVNRLGDKQKLSLNAGGDCGTDNMVIFPYYYSLANYICFHTWLQGTWGVSDGQSLTFGYITDLVNGSDFVQIGTCQRNQNGNPTSFNEFGSGTATALPTLPAGARYVVKFSSTRGECGGAFITNICATLPPCYDFNPELTATRESVDCTNQSTTLSVNLPSATYSWSTGANSREITVSPTEITNTYTVTVTQGECSASLEKVISANLDLPVSITPTGSTNLTCTNESVTLTTNPAGGSEYRWRTAAGTVSGNEAMYREMTVGPSSSHNYLVTVTKGICSGTAEIYVDVDKTAPTAGITTASTELNCNRTSITLTGTGGTQYDWGSGFSATATHLVTSPTTYTVTVKGANGCTATASIAVEADFPEDKKLSVSLNTATGITHLTCYHPTDTLVANVEDISNYNALSYDWSSPTDEYFVPPSSNDSTLIVRRQNDAAYKVVVSTLAGCRGEATLGITTDKKLPYANIAGERTKYICPSTPLELSAIPISEDYPLLPSYSYTWRGNLNDNFTYFPDATTISVTTEGFYSLTVTNTVNGCVYKDADSVTVHTNDFYPSNLITTAGSYCLNGTPTEITTNSVYNGKPPYSYQWQIFNENSNTWADIPGATTQNYTPTLPNQTTQYRRLAKDTRCPFISTNGIYTLTIKKPNAENYELNDYVWAGADFQWDKTYNWYVKTGDELVYANVLPTSNANVFIDQYEGCLEAQTFPVVLDAGNSANLTIGNAAELTVGENQTLFAYNDIVNNGTLYIQNDAILNVKGNITSTGTIRGIISGPNYGTLALNGNSAQTINVTGSDFELGSININNTASDVPVTLTGNTPIIYKHAQFTDGKVRGNMEFKTDATATSNKNSYLIGNVTKTGNSNEFTFPVGCVENYAPLTANVENGRTTTLNYAHAPAPIGENPFVPVRDPVAYNTGENMSRGLDHVSDRENWQFTGNCVLTNVKVEWYGDRFEHLAHDIEHTAAEALELSDYQRDMVLAVSYYNDSETSKWQMYDNDALTFGGTPDLGWMKYSGSINLGEEPTRADLVRTVVTLGSITKKFYVILPIELVEFYGKCNGKATNLFWTTATETNNEWFVIEKSADAVNFTEIGRIAGAGNSIEEQHYAYTDNNVLGGNNYYRLRQIDYDGMSTTSDIISLNCADDTNIAQPTITAYPNPFKDNITIVVENMDEEYSIEIYNELGQQVNFGGKNPDNRTASHELHLSNLPAATYYVRIISENHVLVYKIVKQ